MGYLSKHSGLSKGQISRGRRIQVKKMVAHYLVFLISQFSEIYQVTGPVERFAGQIASQGYVVGTRRSYL
jgi:hypothetical protein